VCTPSLTAATSVLVPGCAETPNVVLPAVAHPVCTAETKLPLTAEPFAVSVGGTTMPSLSHTLTRAFTARVVTTAPSDGATVIVGGFTSPDVTSTDAVSTSTSDPF
jgi:hypothetical protein